MAREENNFDRKMSRSQGQVQRSSSGVSKPDPKLFLLFFSYKSQKNWVSGYTTQM